MLSVERLPRLLFDPRGRADRMDMLIGAVVVVAIEGFLVIAGLNEGPAVWLGKGCAMWIGIVVSVKRLRDLGYSVWWLAGGAGALCMWSALVAFGFLIFIGADSLDDGSLGLLALLGLTMMPAIGAALWLHLAEGEGSVEGVRPVADQGRPAAGVGEARQA